MKGETYSKHALTKELEEHPSVLVAGNRDYVQATEKRLYR